MRDPDRSAATCLGLLAGALLLAAPASRAYAQPDNQPASHPPFMPTRDVTVTYAVQPQGAPAPQTVIVAFSQDGRLMRIDNPQGQGSTILDRDHHQLTLVIDAARVYMQIPEREELRNPFLLDSSMRFSPRGTGSVGGVACRQWAITIPNGGSATACVTDDGVVLSEAGVDSEGARGELTARQVQYGPIPAARFAPPAGYSRVAHPEGPGPYAHGDPGSVAAPTVGPNGQP